MNSSKIMVKPIFIAYVALISLLPTSKCEPLTIDLIHRDSPQSPSYDHSLSPSQRIVNALKRSLNRAQHFKTKHSKHSPTPNIIPVEGEYLMKYSLGTPPVPSLGIADTGSDIIWTQCQPCLHCFNQSLPLFKPRISKTYRKIPCSTTKCSYWTAAFCSRTNRKDCLYYEGYADNSYTYGELATDTVTLASSGNKNVSIRNVVFGCGFKNGGLFSGSESGIVGLGGGKASLVRQLGHLAQGKFSYCLVPLSDHNSKSSKLHFGGDARVSGRRVVSTPLVRKTPETYYYLTLEGISVGSKRLAYYDSTKLSDSKNYEEGNIIIDSGTTLTLLPFDLYTKVENAVKSSIKSKQIQDPEKVLSLCYFLKEDGRIRVPEVTMHFKGADLKLKQDNIFVRTSNVSMCLAAKATKDLAVYGNLAQINFLVGYDIHKNTVSFLPTDCGKS